METKLMVVVICMGWSQKWLVFENALRAYFIYHILPIGLWEVNEERLILQVNVNVHLSIDSLPLPLLLSSSVFFFVILWFFVILLVIMRKPLVSNSNDSVFLVINKDVCSAHECFFDAFLIEVVNHQLHKVQRLYKSGLFVIRYGVVVGRLNCKVLVVKFELNLLRLLVNCASILGHC